MPGHTGQDLYRQAKTCIPGGAQLLSRRPEMFLPENWPAYYSRAKGARVWDLDGNMYSSFAIQHKDAQAASTLFTQLMLEKGFLATKAFNTTFAHQDQVIEEYLQAAEQTFGAVTRALDRGTVRDLLKGPVAHAGFARLN